MDYKVIASFDSFNQRRYSTPWVCQMKPDGSYDFAAKVGTYSGNGREGDAGDLVVFEPQEGTVYGYGQKDYRGKNTVVRHARYEAGEFVACDKLGRSIDG